ncbi:MAG TPA: KamA family radical SAM protein [Methanoregulaceae archaeon]|nr:KamA family radical SAM protein [Methanolinea sp.]MCC7567022.1 KamA family radical SAM protein [Methanoregulaceae archaeon]MDD3090074.1 KamA family radical SAM protein [Methanoregulaceae archaeon]MDD5047540.1 KamA family radical SAM protein [Methanoregulaceae archaeon]MDD5685974.1 KamA family radical SAM protein [Methanoregulaceae archaeon]
MKNPKYITSVDRIESLSEDERNTLREVTDRFAFRSNEYYLSLIDWDDPEDPIRKIIIPDTRELENWGELDASNEKNYTVAPGIQHKYRQTALFLAVDVCGSFCRFCFRKRLFMNDVDEIAKDYSAGIRYIQNHPEITNVLITGGDPLILATPRLEGLISEIRKIDHVQIIRIGTKMLAFNPHRILHDPDLPDMIRRYSSPEKRIYIMAHFNHPREITPQAIEALDLLRDAGAIIVNQTPLLRGINSDPQVLAELFRKLSFIGVPPYYVFQCRPTLGNRLFEMPVEEAYEIFEKAKTGCSGLAKRARFVMSHASGKIEVVGKTEGSTFFKYHQAADPLDVGRFMAFRSNPDAYWFDDYTEQIDDYRVSGDEDEDIPVFPSGSTVTDDTSATG